VVAAAPWVLEQAQQVMDLGLRFDHRAMASPALMLERLSEVLLPAFLLLGVLGGTLMAVAVLASVVVGGWNFTLQPLEPKWEKIDPIAGIGRMFSPEQLTTMLKACFLAVVLGTVGGAYLVTQWDRLGGLLALPLPQALAEGLSLLLGGLAMLLIPLGLSALIDAPLQKFLHLRRLRMSHEEVKKEMKDVEGNVQIKAKIRARMREMANRRMIAAVPGADLVVMNPTHYAVALKYDEATMGAPRVVAKGKDLMALKIRDVAREAKVPVLQAAPLARALYAHAEVDQEIPATLFSAVAQVLAWVFQLRQAGSARSVLLASPPKPVVPPGLDPGPGQAGTEDDLDDDPAATPRGA
jgi:flagellar biosynthetic protein FlhB